MALPTDPATSELGRAGARRAAAAGARPRPRRAAFDKDQATLFLLTITLALGLGAVVRIVQRTQQANAAASQLAAQNAVAPGYGSPSTGSYAGGYGSSQPSYVLPQRSYRARGVTRMS